jgi:hypothetical protein
MSEGLPNIKLFMTEADSPVTLLSSESADLKKLKKRFVFRLLYTIKTLVSG